MVSWSLQSPYVICGSAPSVERRAVEKAVPWKSPESRTFPLHLKIPQPPRDFHFSHRPGYGGELFRLIPRKLLHQDRLGTTIATAVDR
jgi:hypothetical protein